MVRIRMRRVGSKNQPSFRIVAADRESPRDGRFLEVLGFYNPRTEPATVQIDEERLFHWLTNGAQPSDAVVKTLRSRGTWERWDRYKSGEALDTLIQEAETAVVEVDPRTRRDDLFGKRKKKAKAKSKEADTKAEAEVKESEVVEPPAESAAPSQEATPESETPTEAASREEPAEAEAEESAADAKAVDDPPSDPEAESNDVAEAADEEPEEPAVDETSGDAEDVSNESEEIESE